MNEILFREKHIHELPQNEHLDGTWIYGYLCDENHINSPELEGEFLIDPETVCQYTGWTDKNGRKIFDGDILSAHLDSVYPENITYEQVIWDGFSWCAREESTCTRDWYNILSEWYCENFEVCGNVFDNPDLMKG